MRASLTVCGKNDDHKGLAMRITSKGQVTIPQSIREQTGLLPNTEVDFLVEDGSVRLVKTAIGVHPTRGAQAIRRLREHGSGVRMTTDQILALTRGEA